MSTPVLVTKLYIPPVRPGVVPRERLLAQLRAGLDRKLTLVSAPAGFGKTTLVSEWVADCGRKAAWLSLDDGDSDPARFLGYLVASLQTVAEHVGAGVTGMLQSPQPPPVESILTTLLNELADLPDDILLVLDDYHAIDSRPVDDALAFVIEHLPPRLHLVITTREDPQLPLARLRTRGQMTELRAADLRFTPAEAAAFLTGAMNLDLSGEDIAALEQRTEGWIAGLQLAAISMQGHADATGFIQSFTGSHRFVMDYLIDEVLHQQSANVQAFLLRTSILDQLCGSLCDAVLLDSSASGRETLEYLERANLFLVPLDNERLWYRYHHLFAELLRQRLHQSIGSSTGNVTELHRRASAWYEANGMELEAFRHAAAANDVARAERLIEGNGIPLHFRGAGMPVLKWLESLPRAELDARPSLWVIYASALLFNGRHTAVEESLQAAEAAIQRAEPDDRTNDLIGRIASMRATVAIIRDDVPTIIAQSRRALEYLNPDNLLVRTATTYTLGYACQIQKDRAAATQAFTEVIAAGKAFGNSIYTIAATIGLAEVQEADCQLFQARESFRRVIELSGDPPQPIACVAFLGLARIAYQWNDLKTAREHAEQGVTLTRQMEGVITFPTYAVIVAYLDLAQGDVSGAAAILDEAEAYMREHGFESRMPEVAAAQVVTLLRQGKLAAASDLARSYDIPLSQARVLLAQGNTPEALTILDSVRAQAEARAWHDDRLRAMVLQAIAHQAQGDADRAGQVLADALALAEPGGFVRIFVDEGAPMAHLLSRLAAQGSASNYARKILAAFDAEGQSRVAAPTPSQSLVEPLSQRELEVLRLIAQGLSNHEISERLYLALSTVKGHNRMIFGKLDVQRRTEAVARARELGLL
jgi:LuxR family maltose regulon positive regulatory protein